jgi:hypothetical protein
VRRRRLIQGLAVAPVAGSALLRAASAVADGASIVGEHRWGHGLPDKGHFRKLLYNEPSECLIAAFQLKLDEQHWSEDLYYRKKSSSEYVQIAGSSEAIHYYPIVSCARAPLIFFDVTKWNEIGGDWESISSFNLDTSELQTVVTKTDIHQPEFERVWVSSLISARDDASSVFCSVAFEKAIANGSKVSYWLCELRFADFALTRIAELPSTFV